MLVEEELAREIPSKATNNWKGKNQNRDKKDKGSTSKEVYALDCYTEYTPIGTTYTQALECLLSMSRINLPPIKITWKKHESLKIGTRTSIANIIQHNGHDTKDS